MVFASKVSQRFPLRERALAKINLASSEHFTKHELVTIWNSYIWTEADYILRRTPLNIQAMSAKINYQRTPHLTLTF